MPILFKPRQSSMTNAQGKKLYFPQIQSAGQIDTYDIARELDYNSSMTQGDVLSVLTNLGKVLKRAFEQGQTVKIDGVGTFFLTAKSSGKGVETADEVHAGQINNVNICFREEKKRSGGKTTRTLTEELRFCRAVEF